VSAVAVIQLRFIVAAMAATAALKVQLAGREVDASVPSAPSCAHP